MSETHRSRLNCIWRAGVAAAVAMALGTTALAWETVPEISMRLEGDDNVVLRTEDAARASRTVLQAGATFTNRNPRGNLFLQPRLVADTYFDSDYDDLSTADVYLATGGTRQRQRGAASFRANLARESLIRSEFSGILPEDPEIDEPTEEIGTGRVDLIGQKRHLYLIGGSLDFDVSQRNRFRIDLQHRDVSYPTQAGAFPDRSPFDDSRLTLEIQRRVDENSTVVARMFASRYNAEFTDNITDTIGIEAALNRPLSEVWTLNLSTGMLRSDYALTPLAVDPLDPVELEDIEMEMGRERLDNVDTDITLNVGLRMRGQRSTLNINLGRHVDPSGSGLLSVRNQLQAYMRRQVTPRLTTEFGARLAQLRAFDDLGSLNDRDTGRIETSLEWAMNPRLFLIGGYRLTTQRYLGSSRTYSNMIYIGMTYRGLDRGQQF